MEESARRALIACAAECLLDRGAVREARDWLAEHAASIEGDPRGRQLLSWSRLGLGDYSSAKSALVGLPPGSAPVPLVLAELRAHRPEWLPCLAGRVPTASPRAPRNPRQTLRAGGRAEIGASVLGVFALHPGGETPSVFLDVAPALRGAVEDWLAEQDGACSVPGEREHGLVVSARAVVVHREGERAIHGALGAGNTLALALAPILDAEGEVAGWLHVECEHHLPPDSDRLAALARAWGEEILPSRGVASVLGTEKEGGSPSTSDSLDELRGAP